MGSIRTISPKDEGTVTFIYRAVWEGDFSTKEWLPRNATSHYLDGVCRLQAFARFLKLKLTARQTRQNLLFPMSHFYFLLLAINFNPWL